MAEAERLRHELATALPREDVSLVLVGAQPGGDHAATVPDPGREVANAWGARAGELYVVRPDGLLLARGPAGDLHGLAAHVAAGGAHRPRRPRRPPTAPSTRGSRCPSARPVARRPGSRCPTGIDAVPADDREQFLARVALLLGDRVDPTDFREAVSVAASVR